MVRVMIICVSLLLAACDGGCSEDSQGPEEAKATVTSAAEGPSQDPDPDLVPAAPDADYDSVVDSCDQCPAARETVNGAADDDGCPDLADELPRLPLIWFGPGGAEPMSEVPLEAWAALLNERTSITITLESVQTPDDPEDVSTRRVEVVAEGLVARGVDRARIRLLGGMPPSDLMEGLDYEEARAENGGAEPPVVSVSISDMDFGLAGPQAPCDPPVETNAAHAPVPLEGAAARSVRPAGGRGERGHVIDPPAPLALACARLGEAMEPGETEGLSCRRISPVLSSAGEGLPRAYLVELTLPAGPDRVFVLTFESSDGVEFFFEVGDEPWDMGTTQTRGLTGMRFLQVFEGGSEELLVEWRVSSHIGEDYEIVDDEMRPLEWITDTTEAFVALCTFDEAIPKCRALQTRRRILHAEKRDGRFTSRRTDHGVSLEWLPDRRVRITADGDDAGPLAPLLGAHLWPDLPRLPTSE